MVVLLESCFCVDFMLFTRHLYVAQTINISSKIQITVLSPFGNKAAGACHIFSLYQYFFAILVISHIGLRLEIRFQIPSVSEHYYCF